MQTEAYAFNELFGRLPSPKHVELMQPKIDETNNESKNEIKKDKSQSMPNLRIGGYVLDPHNQILLASLMGVQGEMTTGSVYNAYTSFCKRLEVEPRSLRTITKKVGELNSNGILKATVINRGRYGVTSLIEYAMNRTELKEYLNRQPDLQKLML